MPACAGKTLSINVYKKLNQTSARVYRSSFSFKLKAKAFFKLYYTYKSITCSVSK